MICLSLEELFQTREGLLFKEAYQKYTFFDIMDLFRYEDANTNFLASFLDYKRNIFGLGEEPLKAFYQLICQRGKVIGDSNSFFDIDLSCPNPIIVRGGLTSNLHPDLMIVQNNCLLLLEAKLESLESHENQCLDYFQKVEELYPNISSKAFVYLSLSKNDSISDEEHYFKITYQDLIDSLYEPFLNHSKLSKEGKIFLEQYLNSFCYLYKKNYVSNDLLYPIPSSFREYAYSLYISNKEIIDATTNYLIDKKESSLIISDFLNQKIYSSHEDIRMFRYFLLCLSKKEEFSYLKSIFRKSYFTILIGNQYIKMHYGSLIETIVSMLFQNHNSFQDINSIISYQNLSLLYMESDSMFSSLSLTQKSWYKDYEFNGNHYQLLSSYYFDEVLLFLDALKKSNLNICGIHVLLCNGYDEGVTLL